MKKIILAFIVISALGTSCSKPATTTTNYGTFSYSGSTYTAITGGESTGVGNASYNILNTAAVPTGGTQSPSISVNFSAKPTNNGTYQVMDGSGTPGTTKCFIVFTSSSGVRYLSTNGTGLTVLVTVSGSTITATGSGITLEEDNNSSNSGATSFSVHN